MKQYAPDPELVQMYEVLRAQATGQMTLATPRGLALLLSSGLPAWMAACPPSTSANQPRSTASNNLDSGENLSKAGTGTGLGAELACVLTEMVLGHVQRCGA
jgi:hypothetical protein